MTFYNILFGILFLGACRELFRAGFSRKWKDFCISASIALLIFNDALFTSHEVETLNLSYSVPMKLVDLAAFLILTATILLLGLRSNFLGVPIRSPFISRWREPIIWALLDIYWISALFWNKLGHVYPAEPGNWRNTLSHIILLNVSAMAILSAMPLRKTTKFLKWTAPLVILVYILYKAIVYY